MKAYVTSIGEKTTDICCEQLDKFGFEVVLLANKEKWIDKYKRFLGMAKENCIRIDADIVPNKLIKEAPRFDQTDYLIVDFHTYDFYKNNLSVTSPVYYKEMALQMFRSNLDKITELRPERSMTKLVGEQKYTCEYIVGMHGFFQTLNHLKRHRKTKQERRQMEKYGYDFELAEKLWRLTKQ